MAEKHTEAGIAEQLTLKDQSSSNKRVVPIGANGHRNEQYLNQHLNRVMKLIEQRQQVEESHRSTSQVDDAKKTAGKDESRGHSTVMADTGDRKSVKRSITSLSFEHYQLNEQGLNPREEIEAIERGLGRLRIVKSIHTKIQHTSTSKDESTTPVMAGNDSDNLIGHSGAASREILTPVNNQAQSTPLSYFSHQQKQSFVPETGDLVLQGQAKPKAQRLSLPKRNSHFPKRVKSRENSCQTTPPRVAEDSQEGMGQDRREEQENGADIASTQQASSRSPPMLELQPPDRNAQMKITMGRSSQNSQPNDKTTPRSINQTSHQQRKFKMSLLRKDQAKAGQFMMPDAYSEQDMLEKSTNIQRTNTVFNSAKSQQNKLRTAMRMRHRTSRHQAKRLLISEQEKHRQVFFYNLESDEGTEVCPTAFSPPSQPTTQFFSQQNVASQYQMRRKTQRHIMGAFADHNSKQLFNAELNRSCMRQDQMNKTQMFFPSSSQKDKPRKESLVEIEEVIRHKKNVAKNKSRQFHFEGRTSVERRAFKHAPQLQSEPNQNDYYAGEHDLELASFKQQTGSFQDVTVGESGALLAIDSEEGTASMLEQSWGGGVDFPYSSASQMPQNWQQSPDYFMEETSKLLEQHKTMYSSVNGGIRLPSRLAASESGMAKPGARRSVQRMKKGAPSSLEQAKWQIEKRLINQFEREFDKKELSIYEKHNKVGQLIFNSKEAHLFDLVEHPEWQDLTTEVHEVYLKTLEEFNLQLIGQNYFVRGDIAQGQSQSSAIKHCQPAPNRTPKTQFMTKCLKRMRNLFNQHSFLMGQSKQKLADLMADNKRLEEQVSALRKEKLVVHDAQYVIDQLVSQFFAMGNDKDLKSNRLKEAERFLESETIDQLIAKEGRETIDQLDYSNTMSRLQEIVLNLSQPTVQNQGVQFDIKSHVFDPDFQAKIKYLFSERIAEAQKDSALRSLAMVFKDNKFVDVGIQSLESDIDNDLIQELKFYKGETARLQQELNSQRLKMLQHEKNMKAASKEKSDAQIGTQILHKQIKEARSEAEKQKNLSLQYKSMQQKAAAESETLMIHVGKLQSTMDRVQKFANHCEKLFEKMLAIDGMKEMLILEQNKLLTVATPGVGKDIMKKFDQIKSFHKKVENKNSELKKIVAEYRKQQYESSKQIVVPKRKSLIGEVSLASPVSDASSANINVAALKDRPESSKSGKGSIQDSLSGSKLPKAKNVLSKECEVTPKKNGRVAKGESSKSPAKKGTKKSKKGAPKSQKKAESPQRQVTTKATKPATKKGAATKKGSSKRVIIDEGKNEFKDITPVQAADSEEEKERESNEEEEEEEEEAEAEDEEQTVTDEDEFTGEEPSKDTFGSCFDTATEKQTEGAATDRNKAGETSVAISITETNQDNYSLMQESDQRNLKNQTQLEDDGKAASFRSKHNLNVNSKHSTKTDAMDVDISPVDSGHEPMTPITSNITENIIINRSFTEGPRSRVKTANFKGQTDTELFFQYIFDFLGELERRINNGEIKVEDILRMGGAASGPNMEENEPDSMGDQSINYKNSEQAKQIMFSVQELQECLRRLRGLAAYGGDIFFTGIARTMVAKPIIPTAHRFDLSLANHSPQKNRDINEPEIDYALIKSQKRMLKQMTKTKHSVAGGGGPVRDSPPSKAFRAANLMQEKGDSPFQNQRLTQLNQSYRESISRSPSPEFKLKAQRTQK